MRAALDAERSVGAAVVSDRSSDKGDDGLETTHCQMYIQDQTLDTRCPEWPLLSLRTCAASPVEA